MSEDQYSDAEWIAMSIDEVTKELREIKELLKQKEKPKSDTEEKIKEAMG